MDKVSNISEVLSIIAEIRNKQEGFVTNFYLDEGKHHSWIRNGVMYYEYDDDCLLVFKKNDAFLNLFFVSTSIERLVSKLAKLMDNNSETSFVLDLVGRDSQINPISQQLGQCGFNKVGEFVRMIRINEVETLNPVDNISFADVNDVKVVDSLLHEHFNPLIEQLPIPDELVSYSNNQQIIKYVENNEILGFIIFDKNPTTIHLRYWLVRPKYRNSKVGSKLLRHFLYLGRDTKRQILWVMQDNDNAIQKYRHYGFEKENMFDFIMTNK